MALTSVLMLSKISIPTRIGIEHPIRLFTTSSKSELIYKSKPKIAKLPSSSTATDSNVSKSDQKRLTLSELEDQPKMEMLMKNKYYMKSPRFLRPYVKSVMLRPMQFGLSIVILHELTAIIPFLGFWYIFLKYDFIPLELPQEYIAKGLDVITKSVSNTSMDLEEKIRIASAGANSYALTKLLIPIRIPFSVILAPWFDRWVVRPFGRVLGLIFRRGSKKPKETPPT